MAALALPAVSLIPVVHAQDKTSNTTRSTDINENPSVFNAPETTLFKAPKARFAYESAW